MKIRNTTLTISAAACGFILAGYGAQAQNLFVGAYGSESIVEFSGNTPSTFATGMDYPTGLAFDNSGDLFESDQFSGNIYEWAAGSTMRTTFASNLTQPSEMTINSAGDLFVNVDGSTIDEYNIATKAVINTITGFNVIGGLAFDSAGNLYVSNVGNEGAGNGSIVEITTAGGRNTIATGLNNPNGIAFNAAGDLFIADNAPFDTITEIAPGGSPTTIASSLNSPVALAFDTAGDLFVADEGANTENGDITEFGANGGKSVFSTSVSKPSSLAFEGVALPVPEPSEFALLGLGLFALVLHRKKKEQTAQSLGCRK